MCSDGSEAANFPRAPKSLGVHDIANLGVRIGCTRGCDGEIEDVGGKARMYLMSSVVSVIDASDEDST